MVTSPGGHLAVQRASYLLLTVLCCATAWANSSSQCTKSDCASVSFRIDDYFRLKRVTELALSSDGRRLAYAVETYSPDSNVRIQRVYLRSLLGSVDEVVLDEISDGNELAWIPKTHELAFLSSRSGSSQVFSYDAANRRIQQLTQSPDPVDSFLFAPDGASLAYTTRPTSDPATSLYDQFRNGNAGILIDPNTTSSHDFVNPDWNALDKPPPAVLWVAPLGRSALRVPVPGDVADHNGAYFWSSDADSLSVTYAASDMPPSVLRDDHTSVGVFEIRSGRFRALAKAVAREGSRPGTSFAGGEWFPHEQKFLIRRVRQTDPWVSGSYPDWTIVAVSEGLPEEASSWRPVEVYPRGLAFLPVTAANILLENTVRGVHSLFVLKRSGVAPSAIVAGLDGSSAQFRFSTNFSDAAFVNESLTRPPEIYVRRPGAPLRRLTNLNGEIARRVRHEALEVGWKSKDGVTVSGWLLEPPGSGRRVPRPLITFVHGGPSFPFPNAFAPYFAIWPYPLEAYTAHGMAVFIPNYRGTSTYGKQIETNSAAGQEAIDDIVTGIKSLIAGGVADSARLGISGHSHGAYLGPLVMTQEKIFRASSFAEGTSNSVVMYDLMSEAANRDIHDAIIGASLYDSPQLYVADSADLHFAGVSTASLFEAGARTSAILMLGFPKVAHHFGIPTEFIVYPRTAHNLAIPRMQKEAAERNLEWFDFWLNGREDSAPDKETQYVRWRLMKANWDARHH